jgi:hypothetical protein
MPVTVRVRDWADHLPREGYEVRISPFMALATTDCSALGDCSQGLTDANGEVVLSTRAGPLFALVPNGTMITDQSHTASQTWSPGLGIASGSTTLEVTALSQRTMALLQSALGFPGTMVLGTIRDCDGAPVQRGRVRVFASTGVEVLVSPSGSAAVTYGNGLGFPAGDSDRSTRDGVFLALPTDTEPGRIEVWGRLTLETPDVLLGCAATSFSLPGGVTLVDLPPLPGDAPVDCGLVP